MKNKISFLILNIGIFIGLKYLYQYFDNNHLIFLLAPSNFAIELFTGQQANYSIDMGYYYQMLNITIEKSCSGYTFMLIAFMLTVYTLLSQGIIKLKLLITPIALTIAYIVTILANISRIASSIILKESDIASLLGISYAQVHLAGGVFIYLIFLTTLYFLLSYSFTKNNLNHEKAA